MSEMSSFGLGILYDSKNKVGHSRYVKDKLVPNYRERKATAFYILF